MIFSPESPFAVDSIGLLDFGFQFFGINLYGLVVGLGCSTN